MDIRELEDFRLSDAIKFHDKLNPSLWTEKGELDPEVKEQLMIIAKDFIAELGINSLKVEDITISGSNAAYTYTPHSDLDLHILVDFDKLPDDEVYQELFTAKKSLYNDTHDIKVHGVPVELYVQDSNQPVVSLGEYSLLKNDWIKIPKKGKANFNQNDTKAKYEKLGGMIELALKTSSLERIDKVLKIIKRYRKAGLDSTGEFGPENLAFKALRSKGYIKKLYDLKNELHSKELSLNEKINPEILSPNFNVTKEIELPKLGKIKMHAYFLSNDIAPRFRVDVYRTQSSKFSLDDKIGYFTFIVSDYNPDKKIFGFKVKSNKNPYVSAANVSVWNEYQKKGIATAVYKFVKELGNDLKPSPIQTAAGKAMWKSFQRNTDEDYDPNGPPPGPEFPPTMPMGTIRVDVSDVYDWYKLGQHISNMKGLGKHDFGKGPPSTILSFGDEDLEHQYIDALSKTGLDVTDIDPKGHEPKKGIKTDPTYNVNESVKFIEGTNCKNCVWWKKDSEKPVGKDELNKYGGLKPPNKEYIAMSKRVDLVTLPGKDTVKEKGFCYHKDINDWVTERMCCAKWDGKGVIRDYKGESPLMEVLDTQPGKSNKAKWDFSDPSMLQLNFVASNGQPYVLDFLEPHLGPDEINQYELLPDASDKYLDRGYFVQFEQKSKRSPWKQGKQGIEGTGAAAEIFGIVSNAILQFVQKKKPTYLYFQAAESNRVRLYSAMIKRLLPSLPGWKVNGPASDGVFVLYSPIKKVAKEASGYIPSEKEKNDPRFKTALTVDVKSDSIKKNAKAFGWDISRSGKPPLLRK